MLPKNTISILTDTDVYTEYTIRILLPTLHCFIQRKVSPNLKVRFYYVTLFILSVQNVSASLLKLYRLSITSFYFNYTVIFCVIRNYIESGGKYTSNYKFLSFCATQRFG